MRDLVNHLNVKVPIELKLTLTYLSCLASNEGLAIDNDGHKINLQWLWLWQSWKQMARVWVLQNIYLQ